MLSFSTLSAEWSCQNTKCYKRINVEETYEKCVETCCNKDATLASITGKKENKFIEEL